MTLSEFRQWVDGHYIHPSQRSFDHAELSFQASLGRTAKTLADVISTGINARVELSERMAELFYLGTYLFRHVPDSSWDLCVQSATEPTTTVPPAYMLIGRAGHFDADTRERLCSLLRLIDTLGFSLDSLIGTTLHLYRS